MEIERKIPQTLKNHIVHLKNKHATELDNSEVKIKLKSDF